MASPVWTREELILTLELYRKLQGRIPDVRDPDVIALSSSLGDLALLGERDKSQTGRSKGSIIFKLSNFRSLDPVAKEQGKKGFANFSKFDRAIWDEFCVSDEALFKEAEVIRSKISAERENIAPIKANLHILRLLGDELIGSPRLAIFELVKNAYDADAFSTSVLLELDGQQPSIVIEDTGCGMSLSTLKNGWLQIGTPLKRGDNKVRTPIFNRMPLGEKGVGRLAAFRLGNYLELTTKTIDGPELHIIMDMAGILDGNKDGDSSIEDVRVWIEQRIEPKVFNSLGASGTQIVISKLRDDVTWTRRELRELYRLVNSLHSPFKEFSDFAVSLAVPGYEHYFRGLSELGQILAKSLWKFSFTLQEDGALQWRYSFSPPAVYRGLTATDLVSSEHHKVFQRLAKGSEEPDEGMPARAPKESVYFEASELGGIGAISGEFYVFDLRSAVLRQIGGADEVKKFLKMQSGIRVYRDGIRVFNYGEQGDDWLGLNLKRVNQPGKTLGSNAVVGAIHLDLEESKGLTERTNREGFHENQAFQTLRNIVLASVDFFNDLRQPDRDSLDSILKSGKVVSDPAGRFRKTARELRKLAEGKGLGEEIGRPLSILEKEYSTLQEVVASSGAGLNLAIVFHEVERGVDRLVRGIKTAEDPNLLQTKAENLATILDGFGNLLKKAKRKHSTARKLIERAIQLSKSRFSAHKITLSAPVLTGEEEDFEISGAFNFYLSTLLNLIDNAIYWSRREVELEGRSTDSGLIQIRMLHDWAAEGPAIAVLDSGPGFQITAEQAMRPFASSRPGGMGLGLYYSKMAMDANGGDLLLADSIDDLDIETPLQGGGVVMRFRRVR